MVNLLGVPIGERADLKPASSANPAGYWEAQSLTAFNDRLLRFLGGSWAAPPPLAAGWEADPGLAAHHATARRVFGLVHRTRQCVWKDPRTSITLPFWLRSLDVRPVVVMTYRNPLETARSFPGRYRVDGQLALAMWERYVRRAIDAARGLPVVVVPFAGLVGDPLGWARRLEAFLERHGISCRPSDAAARAAASIDPALRHHDLGPGALRDERRASVSQRQIAAALESLTGEHDSFRAPAVPAEGELVEAVLRRRRDADLDRWSDRALGGAIDRVLAPPLAVPAPHESF